MGAPAEKRHRYSPRDSQLAMIIILLFVVMLVVFYGSRALHSPDYDCSEICPCPSSSAESALMVSANAVYNDANAVTGALSNWWPTVLQAGGMSQADIGADSIVLALAAFAQNASSTQTGMQNSVTAAQSALTSAIPLLNTLSAAIFSPSPAALAAIKVADPSAAISYFKAALDEVTGDMVAVQQALTAYIASKQNSQDS